MERRQVVIHRVVLFLEGLPLHVQGLERDALRAGVHQVEQLRIDVKSFVSCILEGASGAEEGLVDFLVNVLESWPVGAVRVLILLQPWIQNAPADAAETSFSLFLELRILREIVASVPARFHSECLTQVLGHVPSHRFLGFDLELCGRSRLLDQRVDPALVDWLINPYVQRLPRPLFKRLELLIRRHFLDALLFLLNDSCQAESPQVCLVALDSGMGLVPRVYMAFDCLTVNKLEELGVAS